MLAKLSYLGRLYELGPDSGKKINLLLFCCCFYFKWPCNELATPPGGDLPWPVGDPPRDLEFLNAV